MSRPDRHDHYLMQIAAEVRRGWVKDPAKVDERQFRIRFEDPFAKPPDPALIAARSKERWGTRIAGLRTAPAMTRAEMEALDQLPPAEAAARRIARATKTDDRSQFKWDESK